LRAVPFHGKRTAPFEVTAKDEHIPCQHGFQAEKPGETGLNVLQKMSNPATECKTTTL
jgi:hypothetical protein